MPKITSDENVRSFLTNVGLITTNGPYGHNVMSCEWTHQISYDPFLIVLAIRNHKATYQNILKTKEFGVNIAAYNQNVLASVAGDSSGKDVDKIKQLGELGFKFFKASKIDTFMVEGASLNAECKLVETLDIGDHPLLIGEVIDFKDNNKEPLIYHQGKYFRVGERIHKPGEDLLNHIEELHEKYRKK